MSKTKTATPPSQPSQAAPPSRQPVHELRLGRLKAAIWQNETETGLRYNVTVTRLYKDESGWKSTASFGLEDLLGLAKLVDQAHSWILQKQQEPE